MQKPFSVIFGGVIAFILLALYAVTVGYFVSEVIVAAKAGLTERTFDPGAVSVVTTIGGLISALVVSKLAVTKPGDNPAIMRVGAAADGSTSTAATTIAMLYLAVWVAVGLTALVVGVMIHPDINSTVSDIGTTWLGIAIAAGYAYFGLDPA